MLLFLGIEVEFLIEFQYDLKDFQNFSTHFCFCFLDFFNFPVFLLHEKKRISNSKSFSFFNFV